MSVTVKYGIGNMRTMNFTANTVGGVIAEARPMLGYGASVQGFIDGQPQADSLVIPAEGLTISVHDKACEKG